MLLSTGIVRPLDNLGRIVLPIELRRSLDIKNKQDAFEIYTDGSTIILRKYEPGCVFCGNLEGFVNFWVGMFAQGA